MHVKVIILIIITVFYIIHIYIEDINSKISVIIPTVSSEIFFHL